MARQSSGSDKRDVMISATADPEAACRVVSTLTLLDPKKFSPPDNQSLHELKARLCRAYVSSGGEADPLSRLHVVTEGARVHRVQQTRGYINTVWLDVDDGTLQALDDLDTRATDIIKASTDRWFEDEIPSELIDEYFRASTAAAPRRKRILARLMVLGDLPDALSGRSHDQDDQERAARDADPHAEHEQLDVRLRLMGVMFRRQHWSLVWRMEDACPSPIPPPPPAAQAGEAGHAHDGMEDDDPTFKGDDALELDMSDTEDGDVRDASDTDTRVSEALAQREAAILSLVQLATIYDARQTRLIELQHALESSASMQQLTEALQATQSWLDEHAIDGRPDPAGSGDDGSSHLGDPNKETDDDEEDAADDGLIKRVTLVESIGGHKGARRTQTHKKTATAGAKKAAARGK